MQSGQAATMRGARGASTGRAAAALLCCLAFAGAWAATPDEDFQLGEAAYRAGDVIGAVAPLHRAADEGHAPAQVRLAEILDRAEFDEEAVSYYRRAAAQGYAPGEFGLGTMYLAGEGLPQDRREALSWFERAAERGYEPAIIALAQAHLNASEQGAEAGADAPAARRWVRRAAELDYLPAAERLANAYGTGGLGLQRDPRQAQAWSDKVLELRKKQAGPPQRRKRR